MGRGAAGSGAIQRHRRHYSNDILTGAGGVDAIDGGAGRDKMIGGKGDDVFTVSNSGDTVVELPGEGIDTVMAGVSFALAANDYEWRIAA